MKITELYGKQFRLSGSVNSTTYKIEKLNKIKSSLITWNGGKTEYYNSDVIKYVKTKEWVLVDENPIQHDDFNEHTKEIIVKDAEIVTPSHYNNENGTLYKVANQRNWNPYLFDIVKRLERADKKGEFESDLNKSIAVIQLWLKENKNETM